MKNIPPSTVNLNYESINNNHTATHRSHYDYCVRDEVSLAKLAVLNSSFKMDGGYFNLLFIYSVTFYYMPNSITVAALAIGQ